MKHIFSAIALLCLVAAQGARAELVTTSACTASLQPHARLVFDAVTEKPEPELALRKVLEARTRELVFMDRLMVADARPAAEAASECLRIVRNCTGDNC